MSQGKIRYRSDKIAPVTKTLIRSKTKPILDSKATPLIVIKFLRVFLFLFLSSGFQIKHKSQCLSVDFFVVYVQ